MNGHRLSSILQVVFCRELWQNPIGKYLRGHWDESLRSALICVNKIVDEKNMREFKSARCKSSEYICVSLFLTK